ncbi:hypothetical protein SLS62_001028 [Diatrype stigma]|uniref:Phosphoribosyltransferase domain-containing protein n=1 Tax=Diatrype stigma TaxID=117547 RepID=A0AAN9V249_9PEZI
MESALLGALDHGLRAWQVSLPRNAPPLFDDARLPPEDPFNEIFANAHFLGLPFDTRPKLAHPGLRLLHATDRKSAKLLTTPMRDATAAGPTLRSAHQSVGWYLATDFLAEVIGLESYPIAHVQGSTTSGYRLCKEAGTLIVALMRGGEAMAFGVNQAFPLARFVHASRPADLAPYHLENMNHVILVDSVVNSGKTVVEFARHVRDLHPTIRVIAVAGVVQKQSIADGGLIHEYGEQAEIDLIALRLSENKFTGTGSTDMGNRLFNTTHLA